MTVTPHTPPMRGQQATPQIPAKETEQRGRFSRRAISPFVGALVLLGIAALASSPGAQADVTPSTSPSRSAASESAAAGAVPSGSTILTAPSTSVTPTSGSTSPSAPSSSSSSSSSSTPAPKPKAQSVSGSGARSCSTGIVNGIVNAVHLHNPDGVGSGYYQGDLLLTSDKVGNNVLQAKVSDAQGDVTFNFTLKGVSSSVNAVTVYIFDHTGETVHVPVTVSFAKCETKTHPTQSPTGHAQGAGLANTGSHVGPQLAAAIALLLMGTGLTFFARKRTLRGRHVGR